MTRVRPASGTRGSSGKTHREARWPFEAKDLEPGLRRAELVCGSVSSSLRHRVASSLRKDPTAPARAVARNCPCDGMKPPLGRRDTALRNPSFPDNIRGRGGSFQGPQRSHRSSAERSFLSEARISPERTGFLTPVSSFLVLAARRWLSVQAALTPLTRGHFRPSPGGWVSEGRAPAHLGSGGAYLRAAVLSP